MIEAALIALAALAILIFLFWRLTATNIDENINAERLIPDGGEWDHFKTRQVVITINPIKGEPLPPA